MITLLKRALHAHLQPYCVQRICTAAALKLAHRQRLTPASMHLSQRTYADISGVARRALPVLRKAAKASAALQIVSCMSTVSAADAAPAKRKPKRVQEVLNHLKQHPMTVTSQPMQYDAEPSTTLPECIHGLAPGDVVTDEAAADSHMARVITGLLYTACGGLDHAHNLVTPLCWGSWTPYGGQPVVNSPAASEAAYVHAIIHRQEGQSIGEFGSGFSNANYWYRAAGQHPVAQALLKEANQLAKGKPKCESHVSKHGDNWSPIKFVGLCSEVAERKDHELLTFCEGVMAAEFRLLLEYCYSRL